MTTRRRPYKFPTDGVEPKISIGGPSKTGPEPTQRRGYTGPKIGSPMTAIRAKCAECSGWSANEIELCPVTKCALWGYRMGKKPGVTKRALTPEQRSAAGERLARFRQERNRREAGGDGT